MIEPPLFVFGTLRDVHVLELVLDRDPRRVPSRRAWLEDHRTVMLPDETYPVLAPWAGGRVEGLLLELGRADLARVAYFEGDEYRFDETVVVSACGVKERAMICAEDGARAGARPAWSLESWQRVHKAAFLTMARAYMALYDTMTAAQADRLWQDLRGQR